MGTVGSWAPNFRTCSLITLKTDDPTCVNENLLSQEMSDSAIFCPKMKPWVLVTSKEHLWKIQTNPVPARVLWGKPRGKHFGEN